jgi:Ohr subfamily peroxiredoxin
MNTLYTAKATVSGGRDGHVVSESGILDFQLRMPKELGGEGGAHTNPEELFAAGWSACFNSALMMAAGRKKLDASGAEVTVAVGIGPDAPSFKLSARIEVRLKGFSEEDAKYLTEEAHKLCPYSKATRNNIEVELSWSTK